MTHGRFYQSPPKLFAFIIIAVLATSFTVGVVYPWLLGFTGYKPNPPPAQYKTITYHFSVLDQSGTAVGTAVTATVYHDGAPLTSDASDSAGVVDLVLPSGDDYQIFLNYGSGTAFQDWTYEVSLPEVALTSEETEYTYPTALVMHATSATYTHAVVSGGTSYSRTQAAGAMTTDTEWSVTAGTNVDFQFQLTDSDTYSGRGFSWYRPDYPSGVSAYWVICSNQTLNVVNCPYEYATWNAAGVANYTFAFKASQVTAGASAETVTQTITFDWASTTGSPSFEVYFVWNTTLSTLRNALFMGGSTGTHATTVPAPLGYTAGGLFQVSDGTYQSINTG